MIESKNFKKEYKKQTEIGNVLTLIDNKKYWVDPNILTLDELIDSGAMMIKLKNE